MSTTLTIRIDAELRKLLETRAAAQHKSVSVLVREVLEAAVDAQPLAVKAGQFRGCLTSVAPTEPWRESIRARNWRE